MSGLPVNPDVYGQIVEWADAGRPFAVAVVLAAAGSTPRKAGTRAIISEDGAICDTIGGGAVEAEAQRAAVEAIRTHRPIVFEFPLGGGGGGAGDGGAICGGVMRVLVDPSAAEQRDTYARAVQARRDRRAGVLLTTVHRCSPPRVETRWEPAESATADQADVLADGRPRLLAEPGREVLIEPVVPAPLLVIAGGGHVGQALAAVAAWLEFDVLVLDDRPEFTDPSLYPPGVATRCGPVPAALAAIPITPDTFITLVTRGHLHDREALAACIDAPAAYIGMIGSRRKVAIVRRDMLAAGQATAAQLDRVHAPIGLNLGARTVPEIAASIGAELIAVRRGRPVDPGWHTPDPTPGPPPAESQP